MDILKVIRDRSTAHSFDSRPVELESLKRILQAGRLAPSAKNRQPWRFVAVRKTKAKDTLAQACFGDKRIEQSDCVIAVCTTNIQYLMPNGQASYPLDLAFAVSHMVLQATHEGLGSVILGTYDENIVKELLTIPYTMRVVLLLAIGHSADKNEYTDRLPEDRIISYDHW